MRRQPLGQVINFRASPRLIGALQERAALADLTVSELMRSILRERIVEGNSNENHN
jgi:hypothetical protein